jgi:predicted nuclease with TOPRIM domain
MIKVSCAICKSADIQAKYHSLIMGMRQSEAECESLTTDLRELRKKRSSLRSQKKKLEQVLQKLEEQDIPEIQSQIATLTSKGACEAVSSLDLSDV